MKIVISTPLNASVTQLKAFNEGITHLKRLGHNVVESSANKKAEEASKSFSKIDKAIKDTDILIAEVSYADSKVGYEIARALDEKKVVIALKDNKSKENIYPPLSDGNISTLVYKSYSANDIVSIMESALKEAEGKLDSKFILIISPEIGRYLDWAAQTKRMHKAQIVRNAVEAIIKKDREYKNYIGN
jgi:hypothetical protein